MIDVINYLILAAFIIRTVRNVFYHTFLWQLKEYRKDRYIAHLRSRQGKKLLFGLVTILKWILFLFIVSIVFSPTSKFPNSLIQGVTSFAYYSLWLIFIVEALLNIRELRTRGWRIPIFTPKIVVILAFVFFLQFGSLFSGLIFAPLILSPFLDKILAPSVAFILLILNIPSALYRKIIVIAAKKKIANCKDLKVIGITGSYGKTSTKEILSAILSENFSVLKTQEYQNTDIGVANTILRKLNTSHEVFVVEMGAYKQGEIKGISEIVHPEIGVITGISQQHLELFGSIENIIRTKFELIESLPQDGVVFLNGENVYLRDLVKRANKYVKDVIYYRIDSYISNTNLFKDKIDFTYIEEKKRYQMTAHILGIHLLENVLCAILVARKLGLSIVQIKNGLAKFFPSLQTMRPYQYSKQTTLVDNTFNTNQIGVLASLEYMKLYKGKKVLVFTPIIELGKEVSFTVHKELAKKISYMCDYFVLTNNNATLAVLNGIDSTSINKDKVRVLGPNDTVRLIREEILGIPDSIVIFEGKEARASLKLLLPTYGY